MAKKELDEDLLTGGNLSSGKDKNAKASQKKSKNNQISSVSIAPKTKKIIQSTVAIVIVVALLVTYVATGAVRKGFIASLSIPAQYFTGLTVSNGEDSKAKIKVSTYNFYFATTYNTMQSQKQQYSQYNIDPAQMGLDVDFDQPLSKQTYTDSETKEEMTWAEHLHNMVVDSIENTYTYYLAAVAENNGEEPEITDEQKAELEDTISQYRETANGYGYTLSGYLVKAMGKGVTESVFRTETTRQYIAQNYKNSISESNAEKEYTAEDLNNYKSEHESDLMTVDAKFFECSNEDDAKAFADELKADGSNFADLAVKYASSDFYKTAYEDEGYTTELGVTRSTLQNKGYAIAAADEHTHEEGEEHSDDEELVYSGLDWLFSSDRKAGDIKQYSTSVVYVISPATISERKTINVRHILIAPVTDDENTAATDATTEQWNTAYDQAKEVLDKFNAGDRTEDSFTALVANNSTDTGSVENGGLYENVVPGQMVNSFSYWCFENGRKSGDTAIVKSDYGYHIMYFVGENDQSVWQYTAQQALATEDSQSAGEKLEEAYTIKENWFGSRYFEKDVDIDA